jgi:hypothetical protein
MRAWICDCTRLCVGNVGNVGNVGMSDEMSDGMSDGMSDAMSNIQRLDDGYENWTCSWW